MKIIIGLGNPGKEYVATRHNVGFLFLDKLQEGYSLPDFAFNKNFNAEISKGAIDGVEVILVKPQTFMNLSGETVRTILGFYKLTPDDIMILHDDMDIAFGRYKIATNSSSAGHNGVQHIIEKLGTQNFHRLRVGIGPERGTQEDGQPQCRLGAHDFVLGKFTSDELGALTQLQKDIKQEVEKFIVL